MRLFLIASLGVFASCEPEIPFIDLGARPIKTTIQIAAKSDTRELSLNPVQGINAEKTGGLPEINAGVLLGFRAHPGAINSLVVTPDGRGVYSGGDDGNVTLSRLSDKEPGKVTVETVLTGTKPVLAMALSKDGTLLAVAQTSSVSVFDLAKKEMTHRLTRVKGRITALAWDPRNELIALGLATGDMYVWSLQEGFFRPQGKNSLDALEHYPGGASAVLSIVFHPLGGSFFAAEQAGGISMWRLLRTELEMGLRDRFAVVDQQNEATQRKQIANLHTPIEDIWLSPDGKLLFVSAGDGKLYSWKVRGLVAQDTLQFGSQELLSVTGVSTRGLPERAELLVAASQDQRLKFLCRTEQGGQLSEALRKLQRTPTHLQAVGETSVLKKPLSKLRASPGSSVIWGAEKSENLLLFDTSLVFTPLSREGYSVLTLEDRQTGASRTVECQGLADEER